MTIRRRAPATAPRPATHYWVTIARDPQLHDDRRSRRTPAEPCYAPAKPLVDEGTLYYWQVVPADDDGTGRRLRAPAGDRRRLHRRRRASSTPRCRRRRSLRSAGRAPRAPVVFTWAPVPEQVRNYTIEIAQDDSFSTILESAHDRRHGVLREHDLPGRRDVVLARARQQRRGQGPRLVGDVELRADAARADDHDGRRRSRARRSPRSRGRRSTAPRSYEVQDVWPDASVHVTSNIPSTAVSYTKMTGTGHGTVQVRAVFANGLKSAYTPTRDVVHTIAEPGGTKTQLINKPGKLALTFAWNTKTNAKQYKVQVSRNPGFVQPFLDETTDQSSYTPLLTAAGLHRRRRHVLARRGRRPGRQHRRVLEGQEVHDPGTHAGVDLRRARQGHAPASRPSPC